MTTWWKLHKSPQSTESGCSGLLNICRCWESGIPRLGMEAPCPSSHILHYAPLPSGCSSVSFYKQQVDVKCFPKFCEMVYQIIKAKKAVMGTPTIYSWPVRNTADKLGLKLASEGAKETILWDKGLTPSVRIESTSGYPAGVRELLNMWEIYTSKVRIIDCEEAEVCFLHTKII